MAQTTVVHEQLEAPKAVTWQTSPWRISKMAYPRGLKPIRVVCAQAPDAHHGETVSALFLYDFPDGISRRLTAEPAGIGYVGDYVPRERRHFVEQYQYWNRPCLSPDGRSVAFSAYPHRDGQSAVDAGDTLCAWILDVAGGTGRRVGPLPSLFPSVTDPSEKSLSYLVGGWAPDGHAVVVMRNAYTWDSNFPVWFALAWPSGNRLMKAACSDMRRRYGLDRFDPVSDGIRSPDGEREAFLVARREGWVASKGPATVRIEDAVANRVLRTLKLPLEFQTGKLLWTPDGTGLLVVRTIGKGAETTVALRWYRVKDGRLLRTAHFPGRAEILRFSRNGQWLVTLRGRYSPAAGKIAKAQGIVGRRLGNVADLVAWGWKRDRTVVLPGAPAGPISAMDWVELPADQ